MKAEPLLSDTNKLLLLLDFKENLRKNGYPPETANNSANVLEDTIINFNKKREQEKFDAVKKRIELFVGCRFENLEKLNQMLYKECFITVEESFSSEEDAKENGTDYHLVGSINESWGYIDMYYVMDNKKQMLITEVIASEQ